MKTILMQNQPGDGTPTQLIRLNSIERTGMQIRALLDIADKISEVLVLSSDTGTEVEVPEEVTDSAISTYEAVGVRLRDILDDASRWTAEQVSDKAEELIEANLKVLKGQQSTVDDANRPYKKVGVQLRLFKEGWIAWAGGPLPAANILHGVGRSPDEALAAFDKAYFQIRGTAQLIETEKKTTKTKKDQKSDENK